MKTRNSALYALGLAAAITLGGAVTAAAQDTTRARSQTRIPVRKDQPAPVQARVDTVTITVSARTGAGTSFRTGMRVCGLRLVCWASAVTTPPRVMAAARPSAYNAEFRVFILVLRRRRPVVWFPAGEVAGATRVVAFYRAREMAHPVPR